ncbi:CsgE family curli-type amyloid fiber assembly protein [Labilibaculum sp. K2S]|uniref:CsgE family curli-type amyloid fiber assembly protein n=1 Tax=Labilibaculum sp. K2S TaxID=3056386 RepID=UPI0025A47DBB|nr:CsgE family curli-type amyloid fiber assembly protein [Labilibaculum sp. K2S]MDM8158236.1 CsgE family curli-type amyloid fiber assembly protein [Labilibaculum sp. K2S]
MRYFYRVLLLIFFFMFFVSLPEMKGQETEDVSDSIKTLKILQQTLDDIVEKNTAYENVGSEMEVDGLVMDETMTKVGRDFYDMFFSVWVAPQKAKNFTITIKEMVLPGLATQIIVLVNDNEVFKQRVQPRYEVLEQMSQYANQMAVQYLNNYEKMNAQLEDEDQQGTGMF